MNNTQTQNKYSCSSHQFCPGWESNPRPLVQRSGSLTTRPTGQSKYYNTAKEPFFYSSLSFYSTYFTVAHSQSSLPYDLTTSKNKIQRYKTSDNSHEVLCRIMRVALFVIALNCLILMSSQGLKREIPRTKQRGLEHQ